MPARAAEVADELLRRLAVVVGVVERDLAAGAAEAEARVGQHGVAAGGEGLADPGLVVLRPAEAVGGQDGRHPVAAAGVGRRVEVADDVAGLRPVGAGVHREVQGLDRVAGGGTGAGRGHGRGGDEAGDAGQGSETGSTHRGLHGERAGYLRVTTPHPGVGYAPPADLAADGARVAEFGHGRPPLERRHRPRTRDEPDHPRQRRRRADPHRRAAARRARPSSTATGAGPTPSSTPGEPRRERAGGARLLPRRRAGPRRRATAASSWSPTSPARSSAWSASRSTSAGARTRSLTCSTTPSRAASSSRRSCVRHVLPGVEKVPAVRDVDRRAGHRRSVRAVAARPHLAAVRRRWHEAPDTEPEFYVDERDAISYLYTSGTTSFPKGVVGSHIAIYLETLMVGGGDRHPRRRAHRLPDAAVPHRAAQRVRHAGGDDGRHAVPAARLRRATRCSTSIETRAHRPDVRAADDVSRAGRARRHRRPRPVVAAEGRLRDGADARRVAARVPRRRSAATSTSRSGRPR